MQRIGAAFVYYLSSVIFKNSLFVARVAEAARPLPICAIFDVLLLRGGSLPPLIKATTH
jgi:hypothetical protein